jgi:AraC-like DNA-binding protein
MGSRKHPKKHGRLRLWRLPAVDDLELFHGVNMTHDYPLHVHTEHSILLVLHGAEIDYRRGRRQTATAGDLMLTNPDQAHSSSSINADYRIIRIGRDTLMRIGREVVGQKFVTPAFIHPLVKDVPTFRRLLSLHLELEQPASVLEQESELIAAIGFLLARQHLEGQASLSGARERKHVRRIKEYLRTHYAENIPLARLTSLTNLSPFYLIRAFREVVGFPPHEYQTQLRIARARKLIRNGMPIIETAHETGFCDQSHLARNFRRIVGMTPGQYYAQSNIVQDAKI